VALDRQSIEKKDFPIGRRGYDPDAVDTHLRDVADDVDSLRRSARQRTETVATAASEQVRAVIAAAEASAGEITRQAEDEAREIRDDASAEAKRTRDEANHHAHDYVGRVAEATSALLQRVDAMQGELNTLLETLRTGAHRVHADLQLLEGSLGELTGVAGRPRFEAEPPDAVEPPAPAAPKAPVEPAVPVEPPAPAAPRASAEPPTPVEPPVPAGSRGSAVPPAPVEPPAPAAPSTEPFPVEDPDALHLNGGAPSDTDQLVPDPDAPPAPMPTRSPSAVPVPPVTSEPVAAPADPDVMGEESARLVALDMALSGTPREETDRYLAEHFQVADRAGLLDEVYASVGG
jgi:DivIVA domain-containing protein